MSTRILILSRGDVGRYMSSPGIRAYYMAQVLAKAVPGARVTLGVPNWVDLPEPLPGVEVVPLNSRNMVLLAARHDIIISSSFSPLLAVFFRNKRFVADLFSQYFIEWMEYSKDEPEGIKREPWMNTNRVYITVQLTMADFILCANERQRDTYIGMMSALGLIDPVAYDKDDSLRGYIDVVPHGVRPDELKHERRVLKGVYAGIRETDTVLMWNGGVVSWYDPEPLLHAMHKLAKERDDIKAVFVGTFYPGVGPALGYGQRFRSALQLSKDLGLYQRHVFFEFGWVAHKDMKDYLLESDIGVCTYFDSLETRYSYRTRFLDLFWAELPLICTRGDVLAQMVEERELGIVVAEGDSDAVAAAISRLADDKDFYQRCRANLQAIKPSLTWEVALEPLVRYCRDGAPSASASKADRTVPLFTRAGDYALSRLREVVTPRRQR